MDMDSKPYLDYEGLTRFKENFDKEITKKLEDIEIDVGDGLTTGEDGKLSVNVKDGSALTATEEGLDINWSNGQKAGAATLGLIKVGDGLDITEEGVLSVDPKDASGIAVDAEGVSVNLKTNGGLNVDADGISIKVKSTGGVTIDQNGIGIDWNVAPKADSDTYGMVKLGDGFSSDEDGILNFDFDTIENDSVPLDKIEGHDNLVKKSDIGTVYRYKGSVDTIVDLQAKEEDAEVGDTYNVKSTGMNFAYVDSDGEYNEHWDALGGTFAVASIPLDEIDKLFASST